MKSSLKILAPLCALLLSACGLFGNDTDAGGEEATSSSGVNPVVPGTISDAMTVTDRSQAVDMLPENEDAASDGGAVPAETADEPPAPDADEQPEPAPAEQPAETEEASN